MNIDNEIVALEKRENEDVDLNVELESRGYEESDIGVEDDGLETVEIELKDADSGTQGDRGRGYFSILSVTLIAIFSA